jgi:hypothetical protein
MPERTFSPHALTICEHYGESLSALISALVFLLHYQLQTPLTPQPPAGVADVVVSHDSQE